MSSPGSPTRRSAGQSVRPRAPFATGFAAARRPRGSEGSAWPSSPRSSTDSPVSMDPEYIAVWLEKPIEALGDQKPIQLIRQGKAGRVARLVSELESPGAV